ncbi:hypothetical protein D3C87_1546570 [compost metagenome]
MENLAKALKEVPSLPGVYIICGRMGNGNEVAYIGKAGSLCRDGSFKKQKLKGRLQAKKDSQRNRKEWYQELLQRYEALVFHWLVTFDGDVRIVPAKAEADLLQAYFDENGRLPPENKGF